MKQALLVMIVILALVAGCSDEKAQDKGTVEAAAESEIAWQQYGPGIEKAARDGKYVIIDFWTSWCHWCKVLDDETYSDSTVQRLIGDKFVAIKVNAESKEAQGEGAPSGVDLARSYQVNSFPTTWFLDSHGEKISPLPGFIPAENFVLILEYVSTGSYESTSFEDFKAAREEDS